MFLKLLYITCDIEGQIKKILTKMTKEIYIEIGEVPTNFNILDLRFVAYVNQFIKLCLKKRTWFYWKFKAKSVRY